MYLYTSFSGKRFLSAVLRNINSSPSSVWFLCRARTFYWYRAKNKGIITYHVIRNSKGYEECEYLKRQGVRRREEGVRRKFVRGVRCLALEWNTRRHRAGAEISSRPSPSHRRRERSICGKTRNIGSRRGGRSAGGGFKWVAREKRGRSSSRAKGKQHVEKWGWALANTKTSGLITIEPTLQTRRGVHIFLENAFSWICDTINSTSFAMI